jgi:hypothetical protein
MPRPTRKKMQLDQASIEKLLQEIYDDTHNIKANIRRLFIKWESKVKENGEVAALGDQIIKLINAEAKNQDQKIMLLKFLKDVVFPSTNTMSNKTESSDDGETVTPAKRNELIQMVKDELEKKNSENR